MTALWRAADVYAALAEVTAPGTVHGDWHADGVSIDTRTLAPGDLFVALTGPNFDAHEFVVTAFRQGAAAAMIGADKYAAVSEALNAAEPGAGDDTGSRLVVVEDTLKGLEALARAARQRCQGRIVAVTGSVGKTSTKETLRQILGHFGKSYASGASLNNHWGVPLSLARLPADAAFGVFELGMNHAGEITPLTAMVHPHVAVITRIAAAHLGFFESVADIARAKAEIFSGLTPGGAAVVPTDTPYCAILIDAVRAVSAGISTFGADEGADIRLHDVWQQPDCNRVAASIDGDRIEFTTGSPGRHTALNALAVLSVVKILQLDVRDAAEKLAAISALPGRGRRQLIPVTGGNILLIDESYNANSASVSAALDVLHQQKPAGQGRRIAVLGDMLELGDAGPEEHAGLAPAVAAAEVDKLYACGALMALLYAAVPADRRGQHCKAAKDLVAPLLADVRAGDVVLIKGSLSMGMAPLVAALENLAISDAPRLKSDAHAV